MNPGQHLAVEEHTMNLTQYPVHTGRSSLEQCGLLRAEENKHYASSDVQNSGVHGGLVSVGGGNFWTDA